MAEVFHKIPIEVIETAMDSNLNFSFSKIENSPTTVTKPDILAKKTINNNPSVYVIDDFLSNSECEHFINIAKPNLQQALVSSNQKGFVSKGRTGKNCWVQHHNDKVTKDVGERIAGVLGLNLNTAEQYQIIYYGISEEYKQHYDSWDHDGSEKSIRCMKYGGQRLYTALCYLNDVEEGGHTRFIKLQKQVEAKKGRLLVFSNVYEDTNKKHLESEHAGMPVIKGEKWAFNLWFREKPRTEIVYNPKELSENLSPPANISNKAALNSNSGLSIASGVTNLYEGLINTQEVSLLDSCTTFKEQFDNRREGCWGKNSVLSEIMKKIGNLLNISEEHFENVNFVKYGSSYVHNAHLDAYDFNTEAGKKSFKTRGLEGQRVISIVGSLTNNMEYNFVDLGRVIKLNRGDVLVYNNVLNGSLDRNTKMKKAITNRGDNFGVLFHIYVRNKNGVKEILERSLPVSRATETSGTGQPITQNNEDYMNTLEMAYKNVLVEKRRNGHKSLNFLNKINWGNVCGVLESLYKIKQTNGGLLNNELLNQTYKFDEYNPVVLNNVIETLALDAIQKYIKQAINDKEIDLGDRQSNRYKARNETVTRYLQYELLPLIRKITGKMVKPTYTYLSCYTKDSDLPPHTDQADCEYTVSFIIEKPVNTHWPIFLDKTKQAVKHKGRYQEKPEKENCIACDCESGGLMIFNGTDHIHYREALEYDYYNIVLLHYRCS